MKISFFVIGDPKPQARPRVSRRGKFTSVHSPLTQWRCDVLKEANSIAQSKEILTCPLFIDITYYFRRPQGHYGTGKNAEKLKDSAPQFHTKKPDIDNLNKAILDAIGDSGLIKNDSQIYHLQSLKTYGKDGKHGAAITIWPIIEYWDMKGE